MDLGVMYTNLRTYLEEIASQQKQILTAVQRTNELLAAGPGGAPGLRTAGQNSGGGAQGAPRADSCEPEGEAEDSSLRPTARSPQPAATKGPQPAAHSPQPIKVPKEAVGPVTVETVQTVDSGRVVNSDGDTDSGAQRAPRTSGSTETPAPAAKKGR